MKTITSMLLPLPCSRLYPCAHPQAGPPYLSYLSVRESPPSPSVIFYGPLNLLQVFDTLLSSTSSRPERQGERLDVRAQNLGSWEDEVEVDGRVDGINQNPVCLATGRFLW